MITLELSPSEEGVLLDFVQCQLQMSRELYSPEDPDPMEPIYLKLLEQLS